MHEAEMQNKDVVEREKLFPRLKYLNSQWPTFLFFNAQLMTGANWRERESLVGDSADASKDCHPLAVVLEVTRLEPFFLSKHGRKEAQVNTYVWKFARRQKPFQTSFVPAAFFSFIFIFIPSAVGAFFGWQWFTNGETLTRWGWARRETRWQEARGKKSGLDAVGGLKYVEIAEWREGWHEESEKIRGKPVVRYHPADFLEFSIVLSPVTLGCRLKRFKTINRTTRASAVCASCILDENSAHIFEKEPD